MNRFDKFLFLLQAGLIASRSFSSFEVVEHLALVFNPNIKTNISLDEAVPVEFKVKEYLTFIDGNGKKPFWLTTGE